MKRAPDARSNALQRVITRRAAALIVATLAQAVVLSWPVGAVESEHVLRLREAVHPIACGGSEVSWRKLSRRTFDVIGFRQAGSETCTFQVDVPERSSLSFSVAAVGASRPARVRITARAAGGTHRTIYDHPAGPGAPGDRSEVPLPSGSVALALHCEPVPGGRQPVGLDWSSMAVRTTAPDFAGAAPWTTSARAALAPYFADASDGKEARDEPIDRPRMLIVGIDGASWPQLAPLLDAGELPTLAALRRRGQWGVLRSTRVPESAMAWTAIGTGVNAGKSGVFMWFSPAAGRRTFWQVLGDRGLRSLIVAVPKAFVHEPFDGVMIGGWTYTAGSLFVHPPELQPYVVRAGYTPDLRNLRNARYYADHMNHRTELTRALMTRDDWNLAFVVYEYTDTAAHRFGLGSPEWIETQRTADAQLAKLLESAGDRATVLVVSDHGWKTYPRAFRMTPWLLQGGHTGLVQDLNSGNVVTLGLANGVESHARTDADRGAVNDALDAVRSDLEKLDSPESGGRFSASVRRLRSAFPGPFSARQPDKLVVELDPDHRALRGKPGEPIFATGRFEHHSSDGIYVLVGPGIAPENGRERSIMDVAATVLQYFGVASQQDADGSPLHDFGRTKLAMPGPAFRRLGGATSPEPTDESDALTENLRALGYIE